MRRTEEAVAWLQELIDSEEIDEIIISLVTAWVFLYGYSKLAWLAYADITFRGEEIGFESLIALTVMLCESEGRDERLGVELCMGRGVRSKIWDWFPLKTPVWGLVCGRLESLPVQCGAEPIQLAVAGRPQQPWPRPRKYTALFRRGTLDELGLLCEKNMEGCSYWDQLFEEHGLRRGEGQRNDYGNTAGYEAFMDIAYGQLGYPDEWSLEEKLKSHGGADADADASPTPEYPFWIYDDWEASIRIVK